MPDPIDPEPPRPPKETGNWFKKTPFDYAFDFFLGFLAGGFFGFGAIRRAASGWKDVAIAVGIGGLIGGIIVALTRPRFSNLYERETYWDGLFDFLWPWRRR